MKKINHLASPFTAWSGHRLFQVVAGTLIGAMVVTTQASAMLPTPEPALDGSTAMNTAVSADGSKSNMQAVNTKITASVISVDANGQETLVPVDANTRLQSGNILEYQGYFTNTNPDRVRKMTVTLTIPEQVELLRAVSPDFPYGSVDGDTFARMPLRTRVDNQLQEVDLKHYKAVRWDIEGVGLNDTVMVKYRAKVK
ncbi:MULTISPECIES: hypothetical protein [unclassified Psychrobacter]|uniref:hypothetical protein n=1 Tax=unclassified Psychrobacter TaxID=196806 RepID=UPI00071E954D|nr:MULTISPECIES: hypothetical protein [unclassified Psychrobacter]OLF36797.1 hypothetical protein BTV98_10365 [Psychrobacter sp. Cmf 22.2]